MLPGVRATPTDEGGLVNGPAAGSWGSLLQVLGVRFGLAVPRGGVALLAELVQLRRQPFVLLDLFGTVECLQLGALLHVTQGRLQLGLQILEPRRQVLSETLGVLLDVPVRQLHLAARGLHGACLSLRPLPCLLVRAALYKTLSCTKSSRLPNSRRHTPSSPC